MGHVCVQHRAQKFATKGRQLLISQTSVRTGLLLPSANEVDGRLCFHRCLFTGGISGTRCLLGSRFLCLGVFGVYVQRGWVGMSRIGGYPPPWTWDLSGRVWRLGGKSPPPNWDLGYGQQVGGTHPTGMLSCLSLTCVGLNGHCFTALGSASRHNSKCVFLAGCQVVLKISLEINIISPK